MLLFFIFKEYYSRFFTFNVLVFSSCTINIAGESDGTLLLEPKDFLILIITFIN